MRHPALVLLAGCAEATARDVRVAPDAVTRTDVETGAVCSAPPADGVAATFTDRGRAARTGRIAGAVAETLVAGGLGALPGRAGGASRVYRSSVPPRPAGDPPVTAQCAGGAESSHSGAP